MPPRLSRRPARPYSSTPSRSTPAPGVEPPRRRPLNTAWSDASPCQPGTQLAAGEDAFAPRRRHGRRGRDLRRGPSSHRRGRRHVACPSGSRPVTGTEERGGRRRAQRPVRRAAPADDHVLRRRRLHRALRPPGARDLPRAHARLPRRVPRRHRGALRGPHRPAQGRRQPVDLRLPGRARERRRAGGAGRARAGRAVRELPAATAATDGRVARRPRRRPPRPRLPRPRRGGHLRPRRQRRRPAARRSPSPARSSSPTRSGGSSRTASRSRPASPQLVKGVARAAPAVPRRPRAPGTGPAVVVDPAGRARRRARAAPRRVGAGRGRRGDDRRRRAAPRRRGRRQVAPDGRARRRGPRRGRGGHRAPRLALPPRRGLPPGPDPGRGPLRHRRPGRRGRAPREPGARRGGASASATSSRSPCWRRSSGLDPSAGYDRAADRGTQARGAGRPRRCAATSSPVRHGRPALLVAEDLHWFDDATRALLADLLRARGRGACSSSRRRGTRRPGRGRRSSCAR